MGVKGSRPVPTFSSTGSKSNVNLQSIANFVLSEYFLLDCRGFLKDKIKSLKCNSQHKKVFVVLYAPDSLVNLLKLKLTPYESNLECLKGLKGCEQASYSNP